MVEELLGDHDLEGTHPGEARQGSEAGFTKVASYGAKRALEGLLTISPRGARCPSRVWLRGRAQAPFRL